jgi:hypothetical protein
MGDFVESLLQVILPNETAWTKRWVRMFTNKVIWSASELAAAQGELAISPASTQLVRWPAEPRFDLRFVNSNAVRRLCLCCSTTRQTKGIFFFFFFFFFFRLTSQILRFSNAELVLMKNVTVGFDFWYDSKTPAMMHAKFFFYQDGSRTESG